MPTRLYASTRENDAPMIGGIFLALGLSDMAGLLHGGYCTLHIAWKFALSFHPY